MKKFLLFFIILFSFLLQGYEYKYNVEPLDATNNATKRNSNGIMYMEMGQYNAALEEFRIAILLSPNAPTSAAYYNNLGLLYEKMNRPQNAQECFEKAIQLNPVFVEYYKNLVSLYKKTGQESTMLNKYLNEISLNKKNSSPYFYVALIYAQNNQKELAIKYLKEYRKLEKLNILSYAAKQMIEELKQ